MAVEIPMGVLGWISDADNTPLITKVNQARQLLKELGADAAKNEAVQKLFREIAAEADKAAKSYQPVINQSRTFAKEMRDLGTAVSNGLVPVTQGAKRYRDLETAMSAQLKAAGLSSREHTALSKVMNVAAQEATRLEQVQRSGAAAYQTDDFKRYAAALTDIQQARRSGLITEKDTLVQLKSLMGGMAQFSGTLKANSAEQLKLNALMKATAEVSRQLVASQEKVEGAFRADFLRLYAGELKQIDTAVRSGTAGFGEAVTRVDALSRELKEQQSQLGTTGREFDQFSRLLQAAATQQERYQKAAEQAQRANDASQVRAYGTELKQLEATLRDTASELGRLDAQQRALRYDTSGLRSYRSETELLGRAQQDSLGAFSRIGQGLTKGKLEAAAQSAGTGTRQYADLERLLQGVERATVATAQAQERSQQAYRAADLSRFTAELRNIEAAQKAGAITAEQAARAVSQLQVSSRTTAASLGVAERELNTLATPQRDVATGAGNLATAQERATRSFDSAALRSFRGELETLLRAQREGGASFDQTARSVESLQSRLREYGSSLATNSREQADLNRILELSDRALTDLGVAAERAAKGFDPSNVSTYGRELEGLQATGRELGSSLSSIEQELTQLGGSFREVGQDANLSARELEQLGSVERELEAATGRLAAEQSKLDAAFKADQLKQFRGELEQIVAANRNGVTSFEQTARAVEALQSRIKEFGSSTQLTVREQGELARVLGQTETAALKLAAAQERSQGAFRGGATFEMPEPTLFAYGGQADPSQHTLFPVEPLTPDTHHFVSKEGRLFGFSTIFDDTLGTPRGGILGPSDDAWFPESNLNSREAASLQFTAYLADRDRPKLERGKAARLV